VTRYTGKMSCPYLSRNLQLQKDLHDSHKASNELTYSKYLALDKVLNAQSRQSNKHDEMLFITIHQTYEIWFKQILFEITSIREILAAEYVDEHNMLVIVSRLNRVWEILKILTNQFVVLETMTSHDFLGFRDSLGTSSGFQSYQFRLLEIYLGVKNELRIQRENKSFLEFFEGNEKQVLQDAMKDESLLTRIEKWLERTPGLEENGFNFFTKFKKNVERMIDHKLTQAREMPDKERREREIESMEKERNHFLNVFDENLYNKQLKAGSKRISHKAFQGALMIFLFRREPRFHTPFQILNTLMNIDEQVIKFRYDHTQMVHRMVGTKQGTGGSSGYLYLRATCGDRYKVFLDFNNLSSYLIPPSWIPALTDSMRRTLSTYDDMNYLETSVNDVLQLNNDVFGVTPPKECPFKRQDSAV